MFWLKKFPKTTTANIKGKVPNPKNNIYKAPCQIPPAARDAVKAIYTMPQGKRPLRRPVVNRDDKSALVSSFDSFNFTFNKALLTKGIFVAKSFPPKENRAITISKIPTPILREVCKPAK